MKNSKLLFILVIFLTAVRTLAQSNPTVEIVLSQPTARAGETVTADIYIRGAVNMGGADVGIKVDENCLRIMDRQPGTFLPTSGEAGGFSPFSEMHDHDTRLAAAITDRSKLANGDGVFYQVQLQVLCASGTAPLDIVFAELSAYADPADPATELLGYTMSANTVALINTQLEIVADGSTAQPAITAAAVETSPTPASATITTVIGATSNNDGSKVALILLPLGCLGIGFLGIVFWLMRRTRDEEDEDEEIL